jgi:hypothetical protein
MAIAPLLAMLAACLVTSSARAAAPQAPQGVTHATMTVHAADGREIAVSLYAPRKGCRHCTLVIFSHGALSTPQRYDVLLNNWAAHGLIVAAPLHTDSEKYHAAPGRKYDSLTTRLEDWRAVDAALPGGSAPVTALPGVSLSGEVIGAGHSYGALIAQVAGGAALGGGRQPVARDWRMPVAVIALSPPGTMAGLVDSAGFAAIARPTLVVTGTADTLPGFIDDWHRHLDSFRAMSAPLAYSAVFAGMNHYFNGAYCRPTPEGAASAAQVARLNAIVRAFASAAIRGRLANVKVWNRQSDAMVSAERR